jgi:hypothetical protein
MPSGGRPPHHWSTSTFLAGLRHNRIIAPWLLDGAINGRRFRAYVEHCLASELAPGDIVVADNLASHKIAGVRAAIEARGASLLFLPAYSPDSTRSSRYSPSSSTLFAASPPAPARRCAPRSAAASNASPQRSAAIISPTLDTHTQRETALGETCARVGFCEDFTVSRGRS